jgi:hypothetical protein
VHVALGGLVGLVGWLGRLVGWLVGFTKMVDVNARFQNMSSDAENTCI